MFFGACKKIFYNQSIEVFNISITKTDQASGGSTMIGYLVNPTFFFSEPKAAVLEHFFNRISKFGLIGYLFYNKYSILFGLFLIYSAL